MKKLFSLTLLVTACLPIYGMEMERRDSSGYFFGKPHLLIKTTKKCLNLNRDARRLLIGTLLSKQEYDCELHEDGNFIFSIELYTGSRKMPYDISLSQGLKEKLLKEYKGKFLDEVWTFEEFEPSFLFGEYSKSNKEETEEKSSIQEVLYGKEGGKRMENRIEHFTNWQPQIVGEPDKEEEEIELSGEEGKKIFEQLKKISKKQRPITGDDKQK